MKKLLIMCLAVGLASLPMQKLQAQKKECGTELTPADISYLKRTQEDRQNLIQSLNPLNVDMNKIPVKIHIVRRSDGSRGLALDDLYDAMNVLNSYYAITNIEFYIFGSINYIDDDDYSNFDRSEEADLCDTNDLDDVINVYFFDMVTVSDTISICGYAKFPSQNLNRIIMDNFCTTNGSTFPHEIGHYFNLFHTHESEFGFENVTRDPANACYNCQTTGDLLCDTPADSTLSDLVNIFCSYTGSSTDTCNIVYTPSTNNIMSYSRKECRNNFTTEQYNRMSSSMFIDRGYLCSTSNLASSLNLTTTISGIEIHKARNMISASNEINSNAQVAYGTDSHILFTPGFWAKSGSHFYAYTGICENAIVNPINSKNGERFSTDFSPENTYIYPNPFSGNAIIEYQVPAEGAPVEMEVYNLMGKKVAALMDAAKHPSGKHELLFDGSTLPNGIYFCNIRIGKHTKTYKLVLEH